MISYTDPIKARVLMHYLGRAVQKEQNREIAKKKLDIQLKQLKKISTGTLQTHLQNLENQIKDTIEIERKILRTQTTEETIHDSIQHKIKALEKKLDKYVSTRDARNKRIQELEQKIRGRETAKAEKIREIDESIERLESIYDEARQTKEYPPEELDRIRQKINRMKNKLRETVL